MGVPDEDAFGGPVAQQDDPFAGDLWQGGTDDDGTFEGEPTPGLPTLTPEQQEAEARAYREHHGEPEPESAAEPAPEPLAQQERLREIAEREKAEAAAREAAETVQAAAEEATAELPVGGDVQDADGPEISDAPKQDSGKTKKRRYYVLRVVDKGRFEQVTWYEDSKGKICDRAAKGAKPQHIVFAHGAEEALRVGYQALGAPTEGARLVAVAALHFQPKTVAPAPVQPARVRLSIS